MSVKINLENKISIQIQQEIKFKTKVLIIDEMLNNGERFAVNLSFNSNNGFSLTITLWEGNEYMLKNNVFTNTDIQERIIALLTASKATTNIIENVENTIL